MKTKLLAVLAVAALVPAGAALAAPITKGSTIVSVQLADATADFVTPDFGGGIVTAYDHSELGVNLLIQHLVSENWALAVSGGIGFFNETNEPSPSAPPTTERFEYSQSSWNARAGFDRVVHLSESVHLYMGPGIEIWSGSADFETGTATKVESEKATRIALSGRMGGYVKLSEGFGLIGHVGGYIGRASADDNGAETKWWPSGRSNSMGVAVNF